MIWVLIIIALGAPDRVTLHEFFNQESCETVAAAIEGRGRKAICVQIDERDK